MSPAPGWPPDPDRRAQPDGCQVCGAAPARDTELSRLRGLLIAFVAQTVRGRWCRDCAESQYREAQAVTMLWGWWGVLSLFLTPVTLLLNMLQRRKIRALGPPRGRVAAPLDPATPWRRRPGAWLSVAMLLSCTVTVALGR